MSLSKQLSINELQTLVDELTKERPNQIIVKELFNKAEIQYIKDPIAQLRLALQAIEHFEFNKKSKSEKANLL